MAYIKHFYEWRKGAKHSSEKLKTDLETEFIVHKSDYNGLATIQSEGKIKARALRNNIEIREELLEIVTVKRFGFGWLLSEEPKLILTIERPWIGFGATVKINHDKVAIISGGGGYLPAIYQLIKHKKWLYEPTFMLIQFDEKKLDPLIALCILLLDSCKPFSPS